MKYIPRKIIFPFFLSLLCTCIHSLGADISAAPQNDATKQKEQKWNRTSGSWTIQNGRAIESRIRPVIWDFHELMNYNCLTTQDVQTDFTEYNVKIGIINARIFPVEILFAFGIQGKMMQNFFAIKLQGDAKSLQTISIIRSTQNDATLPENTKNNYTIETLYTQDFPLKYNEEYEIKIVKNNNYFKGAVITLYIENKKIFSKDLPITELKEKGAFAVASRGSSVSIDYVTIKNGSKTVFTDDFSENSIYVPTVSATKVEK